MSNNKLNRPVRSCWAKWESAKRVLQNFFYLRFLCAFPSLRSQLLRSLMIMMIWDYIRIKATSSFKLQPMVTMRMTITRMKMSMRMSSPRQNWTYYRNAFSFPGLPDVDIRVIIETREYILSVDIHDPEMKFSFSTKMFNMQESSYWIVCPQN